MKFLTALLGVAIAASPLTATRFMTGLGAIDIILAVSVVTVMIGSQFLPRPTEVAPLPYRNNFFLLFQFWLLSILLLAYSTGYNAATVGNDYLNAFLQMLPYFQIAFLVFGLFAISSHPRVVQILFEGFLGGSLLIGIAYVFFIVTGQQGYYMAYRFIGLSENPNQVASQAIAIVVVGLSYPILFPHVSLQKTRLAYAIAGIGAMEGFASAADTFVLAFALLAACYGGLLYLRLAKANTFLAVLIACIVVLCFAYYSQALIDRFEPMLRGLQTQKSEGDQDLVRFLLWQNGFAAGMASPFIGNGAGAWSGFLGPFGGIEAHNSFADWFSIVGGIGLLLWIYVIVRLFLRFNFRRPEPFIFFAALLIFSVFHYVFRHPFFWLAVCACVLASSTKVSLARRPQVYGRARMDVRGRI